MNTFAPPNDHTGTTTTSSDVTTSRSSSDSEMVDFKAVAADIAALIQKVPYRGPPLIRLAWHASGTFDAASYPKGGSSGGTLRFDEELAHEENAGLKQSSVRILEPLKTKYGPNLSYGDLYTLAGVVAVHALGGPCVDWSYGRVDAPVAASSVPPAGRLPTPDSGKLGVDSSDAQHLRTVFGRMGFSDREIVVLSGAHAVGRCNAWASGYDGTWTSNSIVFDNSYFINLSQRKWKPRDWDGPLQYTLSSTEDEGKQRPLMMLPTDLALIRDRIFRKYVLLYAEDEELFLRDFAAAFQKLLELGTTDLTPANLWT